MTLLEQDMRIKNKKVKYAKIFNEAACYLGTFFVKKLRIFRKLPDFVGNLCLG